MEMTKEDEIDTFISSLPSEKGWFFETSYKYEGYWFEREYLGGILTAQKSFNPEPNSVIIASFPKCGTSWFASLLLTAINRTVFDLSTNPLLTRNLQNCVTWLEFYVRGITPSAQISSIRPILKTHTPYTLLPDSIKCSNYPIVYVCRDPLDVFVSSWHFSKETRRNAGLPGLEMEEAFDLFSRGVCSYGSYWDNVLSFWKASQEMPDKVLFLRYEDMKKHPINTLKKLAEFVGYPFSPEEERDGVIQEIVEFCSFEKLAKVQVEQDAELKMYFRKGQIGDHGSYLSEEMIATLKEITDIKFKDSGINVYA